MKGLIVLLGVAVMAMSIPLELPVCHNWDPEGDPELLPNPDDCSTFYICDEGEPILEPCYTGLWYNPATQQCDYPENIPDGICTPPGNSTTGAPDTTVTWIDTTSTWIDTTNATDSPTTSPEPTQTTSGGPTTESSSHGTSFGTRRPK